MRLQEQLARKQQYNKLYLPIVLKEIQLGINRDPKEGGIGSRSWVWSCLTLFEEGYAKEANQVIMALTLEHCHFLPMQFLSIICRYKDLLSPETRAKIDAYIKSELDFAAGKGIHISMFNDNFANMAMYTLLVAGELYGLPEYFKAGLAKLEEVTDVFRRCGQIMEYSSPVYTAIDVLCFAEMVNHVHDEYAKSLAAKCEERMWLEVAALFHKPSGRMAGPISRAYTTDTIGHPNITTALLWMGFGEAAIINPIQDYFPKRPNQVIHVSENALLLPNCAWLANVTFHIPEYLMDLALNKKFPFEAAFSTECIPSDALAYNEEDEPFCLYGGYRGLNYTYMTEEYALGTAKGQYHSGSMSESFYISYKNQKEAKDLTHTNVVFSNYVFNDKKFLEKNTYAYYGDCDNWGFRDEGRKFGIQHKDTSMMVYKPLHLERQHVRSAKLSIYLPTHFNSEYEFYANGWIDKEQGFASKEAVPVAVKAGSCYFGFIPLALTDFGREAAVKLERENNFYLISFYNYEGEERCFEAMDLINAQSGFVCICKTQEECKSMEEFYAQLLSAAITDTLETSAKALTRRVKYKNKDLELFMALNPLTESIFVDTINKRPRDNSMLMRVEGLDLSKIPFTMENEKE